MILTLFYSQPNQHQNPFINLNFSQMNLLSIYFILLKQANCPYTLSAGPSRRLKRPKSKLLPTSHYWFEWKTKVYLLQFHNSQRFDENSFISILLVTEKKNESWPDLDDDRLLRTALDNFHKTSAFLQLCPEKQNRDFYNASFIVGDDTIVVGVRWENSVVFISSLFIVNELTCYTSLLNRVKIGTRYWTQFYKDFNMFYGVFLEVYYVTYPEVGGDTNTAFLFRTGNVNEAFFVAFQLRFVGKKTFLEEVGRFQEINVVAKKSRTAKNEHFFEVGSRPIVWKVLFDSKENIENQFRIFVFDKELEEETTLPPIEKLPQIAQKVYLFVNGSVEKVIVEIPVYCFGPHLESSKLVVSFKFFIHKHNKPPELHAFLDVFDLKKKEKSFVFNSVVRFTIYVEYSIEGRNLVFSIFQLFYYNSKKQIVLIEEVARTKQMVEKESVLDFLSGAFIYEPNSTVDLTGSKQKQKQKLKQETALLYLVIGLFLVVVYFATLCLHSHLRKKIVRKRNIRK